MRLPSICLAASLACGPALSAETWEKPPGRAVAGLEICVDTASISHGPDAKTEYRAQFCGVSRVMRLRVECRGDLDGDLTLFELRPSGWRTTTAAKGSPMAQGAKFACSRARN